MDVDGAAGNSVVELNTSPATIGPADPYGKAMGDAVAQGERRAAPVDVESSRKWKAINPGPAMHSANLSGTC
jgi:Cu2+-containing amine oxidase